MDASQFLDSKSSTEILIQFIATWRNKRAKWDDKVKALQFVFDKVGQVKPVTHVVAGMASPPIVPEPTKPAPTEMPLSGDLNSLTDEQKADIFDIEPTPKATPEQAKNAQLEARAAKLDQLKAVVDMTVAPGKRVSVTLPMDFPVNDLPSYLAELGGYQVTEKIPENLGLQTAGAAAHVDFATGQITNVRKAALIGWKVELQKVA